MELYGFCGWPRIFDLRVVSLPEAGQWDVVALFNWDTLKTASIRLDPKDLGWPTGNYVYYDAWREAAAGRRRRRPDARPAAHVLPPGGRPAGRPTDRNWSAPRGTSPRERTTSWKPRWDPAAAAWSGQSRVVGGDPYELRFTLPPGWSCPDAGVKIEGPLAVLTLRSDESTDHALADRLPQRPGSPQAATESHDGQSRRWRARPSQFPGKAEGAIAYRVYRNGKLSSQTTGTSFDRSPPPHGRLPIRRRRRRLARRDAASPGRRGSSCRRCRGQGQGRLARRAEAGQPVAGLSARPNSTAASRASRFASAARPTPTAWGACHQPHPLPARQPLPAVRGRGGRGRREGRPGHRRLPGVCRRTQGLRQRRDARQSAGRRRSPCRWTASRSCCWWSPTPATASTATMPTGSTRDCWATSDVCAAAWATLAPEFAAQLCRGAFDK